MVCPADKRPAEWTFLASARAPSARDCFDFVRFDRIRRTVALGDIRGPFPLAAGCARVELGILDEEDNRGSRGDCDDRAHNYALPLLARHCPAATGITTTRITPPAGLPVPGEFPDNPARGHDVNFVLMGGPAQLFAVAPVATRA